MAPTSLRKFLVANHRDPAAISHLYVFRKFNFGYLIRRFVVPVVIVNAQAEDMDVFQLNLSIVSLLWKKFRSHLKIEFAILIEHVILRTMRSMFSPIEKKMMVIKEFESWFDMQPQAWWKYF